MSVDFASVASAEWLAALRICGVAIGDGRREGSEVVFENPLEPDGKRHSFRFLCDDQVFMDHHRLAADMLVTPSIFVSRYLNISPKDAWIRLKRESGGWISDKRAYRSKTVLSKLGFGDGLGEWLQSPSAGSVFERTSTRPQARGEYCLQRLYSNSTFRRILELRTELLHELMDQCRGSGFRCSPAAERWLAARGFAFAELADLLPDCVPLGLNPCQQLNSASEILGWNNEQRLLSGLWRVDDEGNLQFNWVGHSHSVLFPVWTPIKHGCTWSYFVTGIRVRKTFGQDASPKEVVLKPQGLDSSIQMPSSLGFSGLFRHSRGFTRSHSQDVLEACDGKTVVLTEGMTDAIAGDQLFRLERPSVVAERYSDVLFLSTGQIQTSTWLPNLKLLRNCRRLIIAFNDDSHKSKNTGQTNAIRLKEIAEDFGLPCVDLLPVECLEGCNDLNDLLRKRRKEITSGAPRGYTSFRKFSRFIEAKYDRDE